jgi:hypothetical protein
MPMVVLDFGDRGPVELNAESSEFPRKSILRKHWLVTMTRFGYAIAHDVFPQSPLDHMQRLPFV